MGTTYAGLRRTIAQRMNLWGGDISTGAAATTTDTSVNNTLIDTARTEPDDEWDSSWIVLNPGSSDQVGSPTIWRRIAPEGGWTQSNGTAIILGTWPSPYTAGVPAGTSYELYKVFRPENWLQAVNFSFLESYPHRHRAVDVEVTQDNSSRILDYGFLAKQITALANPTVAPTVTEVADGNGSFQPGTYTVAYTYFNDFGETLSSPTSTVSVAGVNSNIKFANLTSVPATVWGANFYSSIQPGSTTIDMLSTGKAVVSGLPATVRIPMNAVYQPGMNLNGIVYAVQFPSPNPWNGVAPPQYNTTTVDFYRIHRILQRINPGGYPEIWNEIGPSLWKPLGGTKIMLMYAPSGAYTLKFLLTTQVPTLASESDVTQEPAELVYWGAEWYLWAQLIKVSQIVNVAWQKLADDAHVQYEKFKQNYKMDLPRDQRHVPIVRATY